VAPLSAEAMVLQCVPMGNTSMRPVSFKLPPALDERITRVARRRRMSRSALVREALEAIGEGVASGDVQSVGEAAADLAGALTGPRDLSTSKKHMAGYGR
jgi:predicted transcriptional regulator